MGASRIPGTSAGASQIFWGLWELLGRALGSLWASGRFKESLGVSEKPPDLKPRVLPCFFFQELPEPSRDFPEASAEASQPAARRPKPLRGAQRLPEAGRDLPEAPRALQMTGRGFPLSSRIQSRKHDVLYGPRAPRTTNDGRAVHIYIYIY